MTSTLPHSPGVIRLLGEIHPFYFLDSSGILAVNGFLALLRAQELTWTPNVECYVNNFSTGETHDLSITEATHDNRVQKLSAVVSRLRVRRPTTMEQVEAALKRFRELTSGHIRFTRRVQALFDVTLTMNSEGFGVEPEEL